MVFKKGMLFFFFMPATLFATVIPDGQTNTTVQMLPSQKEIITPATPSTAGVSLNKYQQFDVSQAGVDFNNTQIKARTIVNEVTSLLKTHINGRVQVVGNSAHVVIANPNGIQVDGGEFMNTKGIVLSTGKVTVKPGADMTAQTVQLKTSQGNIDIVGQGLEGTFETLALLAKTIHVDGTLAENTFSPLSHLQVIAGESITTLAASDLSGRTDKGWIKTEAVSPTLPQEAIIDISALGNLQAGSLTLVVTEAGAGVSHRGKALAESGNFTISSEGKVTVMGGELASAGDILVTAKDTVRNQNGRWTAQKKIKVNTTGDFIQTWDGDFHAANTTIFSEKSGRTWLHRITHKGFLLDYGQTEGMMPELSAQDNVQITAHNITIMGSPVTSQQGTVELNAENVAIDSLQSGSFYYKRTCGWFCHDEKSDQLKFESAQVVAGGDIIINAKTQFENTAAMLVAAGDVFVSTPQIRMQALPLLSSVMYDSLFFNASNAHYSKLKTAVQGGLLLSSSGHVYIQSDAPILNQHGLFWGKQGEIIEAEMVKIDDPILNLPNFSNHLGFGQAFLF